MDDKSKWDEGVPWLCEMCFEFMGLIGIIKTV